jgi:hypothetical protein
MTSKSNATATKINTDALTSNVPLERHNVTTLRQFLSDNNIPTSGNIKKDDLVTMALTLKYEATPETDKRAADKLADADARDAEYAAKSAAAKLTAPIVKPGRFLTAESATHICSICQNELNVKSFPPVKSNDPSVRKDECRSCRGLRTGYLVPNV